MRSDRITVDELDNYKDDIIRMFYEDGVGATRIALKFGCNKKNNYGSVKHGAVKKIIYDILGFSDVDEYHRVNVKNKGIVRNKFGFTLKLKEIVKFRDDYKCIECGCVENLEVHHINKNFKDNDMENLVTLCDNCHNGAHYHCHICNRYLRTETGFYEGCPDCSGKKIEWKKLDVKISGNVYYKINDDGFGVKMYGIKEEDKKMIRDEIRKIFKS